MNHSIGRYVFALAVGLSLALYVYQRASDPQPRLDRQEEERIVLLARAAILDTLPVDGPVDIVDPLAPNRVAGKVYVYPASEGWEVSGHYRRQDEAEWHPWLMRLDAEGVMQSLAVRDADPEFLRLAETLPGFSVTP